MQPPAYRTMAPKKKVPKLNPNTADNTNIVKATIHPTIIAGAKNEKSFCRDKYAAGMRIGRKGMYDGDELILET